MLFQRIKQKRSCRSGFQEYCLCRWGSKAKTEIVHPNWSSIGEGFSSRRARTYKGIKPIQLVNKGLESTGHQLVLEVLDDSGEQEGENYVGKRITWPGPNGSSALILLPWQPEERICMKCLQDILVVELHSSLCCRRGSSQVVV